MHINLDYYRIFYFVAKYENITIAAKNLNMSQPSVSRYISILEYETGTSLFNRSKQGVKLTPEGQILFGHISSAMKYIFKAEEDLHINSILSERVIRIGASEITLQIFLLDYLEKFKEKNPNTQLKITTFTTQNALANLQADLVDFAIVPSPVTHDNSLTSIKVASFSSIVVAGKKFRYLQGKILSLKDLQKTPLITLLAGTAGRKYLDELFIRNGLILEPEIELPTSDLITPMVIHNLGIGIVPKQFARQALINGDVFELQLSEEIPERFIFLVTSNLRHLTAASEKFIAFLPKRGVKI